MAAFSFLLAAASTASAHDFWIEPSTFTPEVKSSVRLHLRVGENFEGRPVRRSSEHIERFVVAGPGGEKNVVGREGMDPAGFAPIGAPGVYRVGYVSSPSPITLEASRFESYLKHEGLEQVVEIRRERGESGEPGRELFVRSAKALLASGDGSDGFDEPLGLPLELIPEVLPGPAAQSIRLRLVFRGTPVEGVLIRLRKHEASAALQEDRTDPEGRVEFEVDGSGPWLVTGLHMIPSSDARADWTSYWASLTLATPPPSGAKGNATPR